MTDEQTDRQPQGGAPAVDHVRGVTAADTGRSLSPNAPLDDLLNERVRDTESSRYRSLSSAISRQASDFLNLQLGQLRPAMLLMSSASAFGDLVTHIRQMVAQEEVIEAHASPHVAMMQNLLACWNRANGDFIGKAMGGNFSRPHSKRAVARLTTRRYPEPALNVGVDIGPEPLNEPIGVGMSDRMRLHRDLQCRGAMPPDAPTSRGLVLSIIPEGRP